MDKPKSPILTKLALRLHLTPQVNNLLLAKVSIAIKNELKRIKRLLLAIMKPPNARENNIDKLPTAVEVITFRQTDAMKRNMDIDDKCMENNKISWRKNL